MLALTFRDGLLIGLAVAAARRGRRHHLRALRHQDAEARRSGATPCCAASTPGLPGFSIADDKGNWSRLRRRFLPRGRGGDLRRSEEGQIRAARRQRALQGAAEPQGRRAVAQLDLDHVARDRLRPAFPGGHLLRRPGLHGAARRARSIRALELDGSKVCVQDGHHHAAQSRRLFPRQQHEVRGGRSSPSVDDVFKAYESGTMRHA